MFKKTRSLRLVAAAMMLVMAMSAMVGCSAVVTDPLVAKVGDVEIKYSTFYNAFATYAQYGVINTTDVAGVKDGQEMIMNMLVDSVVAVAIAKKQGVELSDEEIEKAKADALAAMESYLTLDETIEDEAERKAAAIEAFNEEFKSAGLNYDGLLANMELEYIDNAKGSKLIADMYSTIKTPTDEDVKAYYEEELAADIEKYTADPVQYYNDNMYYSYYGELQPLQAPEGLYHVKHILIMDDEHAAEEDAGRDYKALAQEIMDKINTGDDFDILVAEYNEDPGMASYPEGYIIGADFQGVYDEAFQKAAAELKKEGEVSGLVESSYGIHIIKRYADVSTDPIPFEDIKDQLLDTMLKQLQEAKYKEQLAQWKSELDIVTYPKRVQYVGINQ